MFNSLKLFFQIFSGDFFRLITSRNVFGLMRLILFYNFKKRYKNFTVRILGLNFIVIDNLSFTWQYKEIFVDECYKFKALSETPLVYDCGANIGASVLYVKKIYPQAKIKAFEADPAVAVVLQENLSRNKYHDVEVYNKAVWISNEDIKFNIEGADGGSVQANGGNGNNTTVVKAVRLKELLEKEKTAIDFLKMDIEGAETKVLMDIKEQLLRVKNIFVEYHDQHTSPQTLDVILKILTDAGFRYYTETANKRKMPFLKAGSLFQTNIFAVRK